jgi:hypothetical protein
MLPAPHGRVKRKRYAGVYQGNYGVQPSIVIRKIADRKVRLFDYR